MIGKTLKEVREKNNLSQKDLAEELFVSSKTISSWENNRTLPDIYTLKKISELYNLDINDLIDGEVTYKNILKYRIKRIFKLLKMFYTNNKLIANYFLGSLSIFILTILFKPIFSHHIFVIYIIFSIVLLSIKINKVYLASIPLMFVPIISDFVFIYFNNYYMQYFINVKDRPIHEYIFNYLFITLVILNTAKYIYYLIKKNKNNIITLFHSFVLILWILLNHMYQKVFIQSVTINNIRKVISVEKSDNYITYLVLTFFLLNIIVIAGTILKKNKK